MEDHIVGLVKMDNPIVWRPTARRTATKSGNGPLTKCPDSAIDPVADMRIKCRPVPAPWIDGIFADLIGLPALASAWKLTWPG